MARLQNMSENPSCSNKNSNDSAFNNVTIILIKNEIINVLQLKNNKNADQIVNNLFQNGRQSLIMCQKDIIPKIYAEVMNNSNSKLLVLLKRYFQHHWKSQYYFSNKWFISFIEEYQNREDSDSYEYVLTRTAEYGNKYMKNGPILSIVLQILFEDIDDDCLQTTSVFDDLWFTITNEGIKLITKYSDYIDENIMNEQINNKQSILFQAVRQYYRSQLFFLLKLNNIEDKEDMYHLALESVTEYGWLKGIQAIRKKITSTKDYAALLKDIQLLLEKRKIASSTEDTTTTCADLHSESTSNVKHEKQEENKYAIVPSDLFNIIKVRFRPTNVTYDVCIRQSMIVQDVIVDVCRQARMHLRDDCYLWFASSELNNKDTIFQAGLYPVSNSIEDLPEVRLKYVQVLQTAFHIGKHIFLASPEHIAYDQLLNIPLPSVKEHFKTIAEQIAQRSSSNTQSFRKNGTVFIPLPNFSEQSIDSLPTIRLRIPLSPNEFDWNVFLGHLADDLEIDRRDLVVVDVQEGSTKFKIKLPPKLSRSSEFLKKVSDKISLLIIPKCEQYVMEQISSSTKKVEKIQAELKNFSKNKKTEDSSKLSLSEIETTLRHCERPVIINKRSWDFMTEKSRQIRTSILQSVQTCSDEYIIDHASIIYNEQIYEKYENLSNIDKTERILFHGTDATNFDGIFEQNFKYNCGVRRTDKGWYGQGIYFSSSPKKALYYAKSDSKVSYLICSVVRLGKTLTVTDQRYKGKHMHPDYDSHYIPIRIDGDPISSGEKPAFEEFVIKRSEQIMPLYIVGVLKVSRFVVWRDANITNEANSSIFESMKERYAFNIYGTQTSVEALDILTVKLKNESMKCVVVTNGADDGEGFVRQCRSIQPSIPIVVYCKSKAYHQQWAATLPEPKINVTTSPEEVFNYITNTLQK